MYPVADLFASGDLTPDSVLDALGRGESQSQTAAEVVRAIKGHTTPGEERQLRYLIEALRKAGHPVCAHPSHGYYLAATDAELDRCCEFLYSRAMTSLTQVSAMRRVSLPDLRGQLRLPASEEKSHERKHH